MKRSNVFSALVILIAIFLLFFRLGANYLVSFDEGFYAVIAREMVKNRDPITLTFGGEQFFAASPLYIWVEAGWFSLFGPSEFGVRFFAAASSLGTILAVIWYFRKEKKPLGGVIASLVVISSIKFLFLSRVGNVDATLSLFTTLSLIFFYRSFGNKRYLPLAMAASGLAFLSKGLFGIFPLAVFFTYALVFHRQAFRTKYLFAGITLFFLIIVPWQTLQWERHGEQFFQFFYGGYMSTKIGSQPFFSRLWWGSGLWQGMKLWLPISIIAIVFSLLKKRLWRENLFFIWAIVLYLGGLSFITTHNDWYLMPTYPLFSLIIGTFFLSFFESDLSGFKSKVQSAKSKITNTNRKFIGLTFIGLIALFQLARYHNQYFTPQTTDAQVMMVKEAETISPPGEPILLDDFYYPVAIFYSTRPVILLRGNRDRFSLIRGEALNTYLANGSALLTNTTTVESAKEASKYPVILEKTHGELLLFRAELGHGKILQ